MLVFKCEKCNKEIKESEIIKIGRGYHANDFCLDCGSKLLSKIGQEEFIKSKT